MAFGYQVLGFGAGGPAFILAEVDVDYLVVGGGGSGGYGLASDGAGGGGAGGYRTSFPGGTKLSLTNAGNTSYVITVGAGGTGPGAPPNTGRGGDSELGSSQFPAALSGGGGNAGRGAGAPAAPGASGGGGGGSTGSGGTGNQPPVSPPQGNPGANAPPGAWVGGGGGGHAGAGSGQSAGAGTANTITDSSKTYAAGGSGGPSGSTVGTPGTDGEGDGGHGSQGGAGLPQGIPTGGTGTVVVRAPSSYTFVVTPATNTVSTIGPGENVAVMTVTGTLAPAVV
jgi:hypothetical protein